MRTPLVDIVLTSTVPVGTVIDMKPDTDMMPPTIADMVAAVDEADDSLEELVHWLEDQTWSNFAQDVARFYRERGFLSKKQIAAAVSMRVKVESKASLGPKPDPITEDGMYLHPDGSIYKVQVAVHGSGRLYAKRLVVDEDADEGKFVYAPGAIKKLSPTMKMTLEQAQGFGSLYGLCCVCGRTLTNEQSIDEGIGPVCKGRFF